MGAALSEGLALLAALTVAAGAWAGRPLAGRRMATVGPAQGAVLPRWRSPFLDAWFTRRELARAEADLPDLVEGTVRGLRAGLTLPVALVDAGRRLGGALGRDTELIDQAMRRGLPFSEAIGRWERSRRGSAPVALGAAVLVLAASAGGRASLALEGVAATLRERIDLQREVRAQASQARASAAVMVALPPGFLVVTAVVDPRVLAVLLGTRLGWVCLVLGGGLNAVAAVWMHRIVSGVLR